MIDNFNPRVPGMIDGPVFQDKQITVHADYHIHDRIPVTIAPNTGDLDKGTIIGAGTADGLYRPVRRTAIAAAVAASATTVQVTDATKFKVGDPIYFVKADGTGAFNAGTVTLIANNVITFATQTTGTFAINDYVYVADGSQTALLILGDVVLDATSNKIANAFVQGKFLLTQLVGVDPFVTKDLMARVIPYGQNAQSQNEFIYVV